MAGIQAIPDDPSPLAGLGVREIVDHLAFTNNLSLEESKPFYDRYAIPVSGRMLFQGGFADFTPNVSTTVNFANNDRAPLLFIAGANDHILPPAVPRQNYKRNSKQSTAITAFKLFEGRDHFVLR